MRFGVEVHVVSITHRRSGRILNCSQKGAAPSAEIPVSRFKWPRRAIIKAYLAAATAAVLYKIPIWSAEKVNWKSAERFLKRRAVPAADIVSSVWTFPHVSWDWARHAFDELTASVDVSKYDVVVGSHPFSGMLYMSYLIGEKYQLPWIADMRDPWHNDVQLRSKLLSRRLEAVERRLLSSATGVVTINRHLAAMLQVDRPVHIVPNCYDGAKELRARSQTGGAVIITYTGSIQEKSRWENFFNALLGLSGIKSNEKPVVIRYLGGSFEKIRKYQNSLRSRGILLENAGFRSERECNEACSNSDLLLVFGWSGAGKECVLTGKIFDYISSGRPVLAVTERQTALGELIYDTGLGEIMDEKSEIIEFFSRLRLLPDVVLSEIESKRDYFKLSEYSAESCAAAYHNILLQALRKKGDC